jgi:annexin A7/11
MKEALLYIVNGAENHAQYGPGVWRDAQLIYNAMEGKGTNNKQLVWRYATLSSSVFMRMFSCEYSIATSRLVRAHWDAYRMAKIKEAYRVIAKEDLARRVRSETSGAYRTLMVALVDGIDWMNK